MNSFDIDSAAEEHRVMRWFPIVMLFISMALLGSNCGSTDDDMEGGCTPEECATFPCQDDEVGVCNEDSGECECESLGTGGTAGTGAGGTNGSGATGGSASSTCGSSSDSTDPGLASDVAVTVDGMDVSGDDPPVDIAIGDTIDFDFQVTDGTTFVTIFVVNQDNIAIAQDGADVGGGSQVSMTLTVNDLGSLDNTLFGWSIALDDGTLTEPPTQQQFFNTVLPGCDAVQRFIDDMGEFSGPFDTTCTGTCFSLVGN